MEELRYKRKAATVSHSVEDGYSSDLSTAAPGLFATLFKACTKEELHSCVRAYRRCHSPSSVELPWVVRSKGANFNPRAARVAQILWNTCDQSASLAIDAFKAVGDERHAALQETKLALSIDALRHLHMSSLQDVERKSVIYKGKCGIEDSVDSPLHQLLIASVARAERFAL